MRMHAGLAIITLCPAANQYATRPVSAAHCWVATQSAARSLPLHQTNTITLAYHIQDLYWKWILCQKLHIKWSEIKTILDTLCPAAGFKSFV